MVDRDLISLEPMLTSSFSLFSFKREKEGQCDLGSAIIISFSLKLSPRSPLSREDSRTPH